MKKERKFLLNSVVERIISIGLLVAIGTILFASGIFRFSGKSASIKAEEPKREIHEGIEEDTESGTSWIFGEETGVSGLIPISCTRVKSIYTYTLYDPETGIMYYLVKDGNNAATASGSGVLENPDGTPRIYAPYQKDSGN